MSLCRMFISFIFEALVVILFSKISATTLMRLRLPTRKILQTIHYFQAIIKKITSFILNQANQLLEAITANIWILMQLFISKKRCITTQITLQLWAHSDLRSNKHKIFLESFLFNYAEIIREADLFCTW